MELIQNNARPTTAQDDSPFNLQDILRQMAVRWYWFVFSLLVCLAAAGVYILSTPPTYTRTASLLIKADGKAGGSADAGVLGNVDIFQTSTNVNNELVAMRSPALMLDVVKRLDLDIEYTADGNFYRRVLYGAGLPYRVEFGGLDDSETASLIVRPDEKGGVVLTDFTRNGEDKSGSVHASLGKTVHTPVGPLTVTANHGARAAGVMPVYVERTTPAAAVGACLSRLGVALQSEETTIVDLTYTDVNTQRAEEVLNTLIAAYNENWVKDKNQIAVSTSMFINDRLGVIEQELGHVDENISSYKSANLLPDVQAASSLYMSQSSETNAQIMELNTQLSMARYIRNYMTASGNRGQLLPANTGLQGGNVEQQISEYNAMQLQRNNLVANSSESNPLVTDMDHSLSALHDAIISSIDNLIVSLNTQIASLERSEAQTTARIAANPGQAKHLLSVERQQKVKEQLYLFLLQKREENELSQAFTAYNTRLITPPTGSETPTSPKKAMILFIALLAGLALPTLVIVGRAMMTTTVRGRRDLEYLATPFLGEIPQQGKRRRFSGKRRQDEWHPVVVEARNRNLVNEAFRSVRTNLEFMAGASEGAKVVMITSFNPSSGKTFVSINIATCMAVKGKKTVVVDLDLRRASLSRYAAEGRVGVTDFLAGQDVGLDDITCPEKEGRTGLSIIPVGTLPPNPAELLASERLGLLFEQLRRHYDYVFVDCPPVEVVTDADLISRHVDMTLLVVRAGLMHRAMLPQVDKLYAGHRFKNMALVLNGTNTTQASRYGYQYGYGRYAEK